MGPAFQRGSARARRLALVGFLAGLSALLYGCAALQETSDQFEAVQSGRGHEAAERLLRAAREAERAGDLDRAIIHYQNAFHTYRILGDYQNALTYARKPLELVQGGRLSKPEAAVQAAHINLGVLYVHLSQYDKSLSHYEEALKVRVPLDHWISRSFYQRGLMTIHLGLGRLHSLQGDWRRAIEEFEKVQKLYAEYNWVLPPESPFWERRTPGILRRIQQVVTGGHTAYLMAFPFKAEAHLKARQFDEAEKVLLKALPKIEGQHPNIEVLARIYLGRALAAKGNTGGALESYGRAYELAERYRLLDMRVLVLAGMGRAESGLGQKEKSVATFKRAVEAVEPMRASLVQADLRTSFFESRLELYNSLVWALVELERGDEAYHYVERARSRAFLDLLGTKVSLAKKRDEGFEKEELALRESVEVAALSRVESPLPQDTPSARAPEARTRALDEGLGRHRDILVRIKKESPEFASLVSIDPLKIEGVQRLLEPGVLLLEYFVMPKGTLLWVVSSEERRVLSLPIGQANLEERVRGLRRAIETRAPMEEFRGMARALYEILIQPAKPHLKGRHLILVPHLALHYLPFGALLSPEGRYLLEDFGVSLIPSGSILKFALEKRRKVGERVLALGNPDLGDPRFDLPFAEREVLRVASLYPQTSLHTRRGATKGKVVSVGSQFDVLHFATHAEFNDVSPLHSSLRLAAGPGDEGRLEVHEIFRLDLEASLVTLSACQTGVGKVSAGDEITSLHRAFLYAGTPSVVASLWKVDDEATATLMGLFYRHLRGRPKAESLRLAQLETSRSFPHPFYWAAFSMTGDYQ